MNTLVETCFKTSRTDIINDNTDTASDLIRFSLLPRLVWFVKEEISSICL